MWVSLKEKERRFEVNSIVFCACKDAVVKAWEVRAEKSYKLKRSVMQKLLRVGRKHCVEIVNLALRESKGY